MILMRQLTEQTNNTSNDALTRILEHQGQMLERLSIRSTGTPREQQVKLPILTLPTKEQSKNGKGMLILLKH